MLLIRQRNWPGKIIRLQHEKDKERKFARKSLCGL
jgi:hypothetical protein